MGFYETILGGKGVYSVLRVCNSLRQRVVGLIQDWPITVQSVTCHIPRMVGISDQYGVEVDV